MDKGEGEGGSIKIFRRIFFVSQCRKFRNGIFYCFTNFGYRKKLGINHEKIWHDRDSNPEPTAWDPCCPNPTAVIYFWIKRVDAFGLKKKEKWPYWMNNFSCILHVRRKTTMPFTLLPLRRKQGIKRFAEKSTGIDEEKISVEFYKVLSKNSNTEKSEDKFNH